MNDKNVVVLGAGVIGLTTAVVLLENNFDVLIVAEHFPGKLDKDYTSPWAGAVWRSKATNSDYELIEFETKTFKKWLDLSKNKGLGDIIKIARLKEYQETKPASYESPWFKDLFSNFRELEKHEMPVGATFGIEGDTICVDSPRYLIWLKQRALELGAKTLERKITHISECFDLKSFCADIVVNCSGLGSKFLTGVNDTSMVPIRGQTILVSAPSINSTTVGLWDEGIGYIIPRGDGTVILGGTMDSENNSPDPDSKIAQEILERCERLDKNVKTYKILRHNVGFRPSRKGGIRIQTERIDVDNRKNLVLCHHYGHGGFGFQSSWGSSEEIVKQLISQLQKLK